MISYKEIKKNKEVMELIKKGSDNLKCLGFTDHSEIHSELVAKRAAYILEEIGCAEEQIEIAKKLLEMNMSVKDIQKATDLSKDEISFEDDVYPTWYIEVFDNHEKYMNKTFKFKVFVEFGFFLLIFRL